MENINIGFKLKLREINYQFLNFEVQIKKPLKLQEDKVHFSLN